MKLIAIRYSQRHKFILSLMYAYNYEEIISQQDASKSNRSKYYVTNP